MNLVLGVLVGVVAAFLVVDMGPTLIGVVIALGAAAYLAMDLVIAINNPTEEDETARGNL